jgi:hypothetical protein
MYSKREVCFTFTLALGVCFTINPRQDTVRLRSHGPSLTLVDGVHPPPPPLPPPKLGSTGQLQADGVHPPPPPLPPPKLGSTGQLQADGVHPPPPTLPPPKFGNRESLQTARTEALLHRWLSDSSLAS